MAFISKSAYLNGLQCAKLLWFRYNAKDQLAPADASQQAIFDQGHEVGTWAKTLFPDGIEIDCDHSDYEQVLRLSTQHLATRRPLFEAGFSHNGGFARVDVLEPAGNQWNIVEVKSSTQLKPINLDDIAFQTYVLRGAGVPVDRCFLMHINNEYVRKGAVDASALFTRLDVTDEIVPLIRMVESRLGKMQRTTAQAVAPEIRIGTHCNDPYPCPLHDHCWDFLPDNHLLTLYRINKKKAFALLGRGIHSIDQLPEDFKLTDNQSVQRGAVMSGKPHVDRSAIQQFLSQLKYPVSFLDFETFSTAVPMFDDVSPYQQIPFQFSLHVLETPETTLKHHGYLHDSRMDPRQEFMRRLRELLPDAGSVVVFNASFEKTRLKECCELLPEYSPWWRQTEQRIVDLLNPFRAFDYYHPSQQGSASIKVVMPALTGKGYEDLEIQEGGTASREFLRVTFTDVPESESARIHSQLEIYCGLDTEGMARIVGKLRTLV